MAEFVQNYLAGRQVRQENEDAVRQQRFNALAGDLYTAKDRAPVLSQMASINPQATAPMANYFAGQDQRAAEAAKMKDQEGAKLSLYKAQAIRSAQKGRKAALWQQLAPEHYQQMIADGTPPTDEEIDAAIDQGLPELYAKAGVEMPGVGGTGASVHSGFVGDDGYYYVQPKNSITPVKTEVRATKFAPRVVNNETGTYAFDPRTRDLDPMISGGEIAAAARNKNNQVTLGKEDAQRFSGYINEGMAAADSLPVINRAIELLDSVKTGGIDAAKLAATNLLGVTGADEAELSNNLGKAVLSQLRATFGAQFTEREGARLQSLEAGFGKSTEGNKRILGQVKQIVERAARRGIDAAKRTGDDFTISEIENSLNMKLAPKQQATQGGPVRVNTPQEAMALPPGTQFQTPDGRIKVRP